MADVYWLKPTRSAQWAARGVYIVGAILAIGLIPAALVAFATLWRMGGENPAPELARTRGDLEILLLALVIATAMIIPVFRNLARTLRRRIGTDGHRLFVRLEDGRVLSAAPDELAWTPQMILLRGYVLPLRNHVGKGVYLNSEIERHIEPLLQNAARLSPREALLRQWKSRESAWLRYSIPVAAIVLAAVLLLRFL